MNRRIFLQRFGIGLSAALVLAQLPASAVAGLTEVQAGDVCASVYLRRRYNEYMKEHPGERYPRMEVPLGLFKAFDSECASAERYRGWTATTRPYECFLYFKAGCLYAVPDMGPEWDVRFLPAEAL